MATHSSILAWEILWTEEPGGLQSMGSQKSWTRQSHFHFSFSYIKDLSKDGNTVVKVKVAQSCLTLCDPMDCPWNSLGQNTGVGSLSLLQGIFPTQGLNPGLPHCGWILYQLSHKGSPVNVVPSAYLRLLILLPAIMIPAWSSSSPAFRMIYSAFKLNKQCDNMPS